MQVEQLLWSFTSDSDRERWQEVIGTAEVGIGTVDSYLRCTRRRRGARTARNLCSEGFSREEIQVFGVYLGTYLC